MPTDLLTRAREAVTDDTIPEWVSCEMRRRAADREAVERRNRVWVSVASMRDREAANADA